MRVVHAIGALNFRSLQDVLVELNDLSVLVGPNGAGKSNVLDVFRFLATTAQRDLPFAIAARGGWDRLLFRGAPERDPTVVVALFAQATAFASPNAPDQYTLAFSVEPGTLFRAESLLYKRRRGPGRRISVHGTDVVAYDEQVQRRRLRAAFEETLQARLGVHGVSGGEEVSPLAPDATALATLGKLGDAEGAEQFRALAGLLRELVVFDVNVGLAVLPARAPDVPVPLRLAEDASNLAPFLVGLKSTRPDLFEQIESDLARVVPSISRIVVAEVGGAAPALHVELEERALRGRTYLADASYGTVRALGLLAALHDPNPPRMLCIEEVDHGLHPHALDLVVERVRDASRRTQLLLATHSPALVNRLDATELIVCERDLDSGASRIPAISAERVREKERASGLGLGELWFSGSLGGGLE